MKYPFPKNTLYVPLILLGLVWGGFLLQHLGFGSSKCYGVVPRNFIGLRGILFSPILHSGWRHIINNSVPLAVLSFFAVLFYQRTAYYIILLGWILTGLLVWIFGNLFPNVTAGCHIGASGLVYVLASYIFFSGIIKKSRNLIALSLIVAFLYGSMIWGVVPDELLPRFYAEGSNPISWESHLAGGLVGLLFAFLTRHYGPEEKSYSWEESSEPDSREKWLWERYKESLSEAEKKELEEKYGESSESEKDEDDDDYWFTTFSNKE